MEYLNIEKRERERINTNKRSAQNNQPALKDEWSEILVG